MEIPVRIAGERQFMRIYYFKPHRYHADRPVVFVMHGVKRNADVYRNAWKELAWQHKLLVVAPEFSKKQFPGSRSYNLGNVFARGGALNPASEWSFTIIDQLFAKFADLFGSACSKYNILDIRRVLNSCTEWPCCPHILRSIWQLPLMRVGILCPT